MTCQNCNKVFADGFAFCPHCGNAASAVSSTATPIAEIKPTSVDQTDLPSVPERQSPAGGNKVGTVVFASFAALCLLIFFIRGLIPIYLLEALAWAGAAWFWQKKQVETSFAKGFFVCLAIMVALGEVALMFNNWRRAEEYKSGYSSTTVSAYIQPEPIQPQQYSSPVSPTPSTAVQQPQPVESQKAKESTPRVASEKKTQIKQSVGTPAVAEGKTSVAPPVSCSQVLEPGRTRTAKTLDAGSISRIRGTMENVQGQRSFLLTVHNGSDFCVTEIAVSFQYKDDETGDRRGQETLRFLPGEELAPGQDGDRAVCEFRPEGEFHGGALDNMCRAGVLEEWHFLGAEGFIAGAQQTIQ